MAIVKWRRLLWVSTQEHGLITIEPNSGQWHQLTKESSKSITGLYLGPLAENLYLTIDDQLYKVDSVVDGKVNPHCITCSLVLNSLTINDPQTGQLFKGNGLLTSHNEFLISSVNKLLAVPINELEEPQSSSRLMLTNYQVMGKSVKPSEDNESALLKQSIEKTKRIVIPPETTFFSFSFAKVGALQADRVKYAYKMEGLNKTWIETQSKQTEAIYSLLRPGDYTFKVKATDGIGHWNDRLSLDISVLPPWWETWWAYSFYLGCFVFLFWLFYRAKLLKKARQSAIELAVAKEQLFANISHEFRTPLTLILGPAKVIKTASDDSNVHHNANLIERNAHRLLSMVDQLLQLAQLKELQKKSTSTTQVSTVCRCVIEAFEHIVQEKQITIKLSSGLDDSWWVSGEQNALETILYNLLTNAVKYTKAGGVISLEVVEQGQWLEFKVADSGCGIAEHELSIIFDRFTRLENNSSHMPGAGIGLALVKELVEILGGKIVVNSRLNEGSSFIFTLPKVKPATSDITANNVSEQPYQIKQSSMEQLPNTGATEEPQVAPQEQGTKPSVLIVDDNIEMRQFIRRCLAESYQVFEAEHGLELAIKYGPDLIVSDVMMPVMNGFEFLNSIRNEVTVSHTPVVLLTAKGDQQSKLKGLSNLADDYITKPFESAELLIRMQRLLGVRTILQKRFNNIGLTAVTENIVKTVPEEIKSEDAVPLTIADISPNQVEQTFLRRLNEILEQNYTNSELSLAMISSQLAMSDRQLQRKLKAISGTSFSEMLREYRLVKGRLLLQSGLQIAVIADEVGFNSSSYFVRCFKAKYGKTPNDYRKVG